MRTECFFYLSRYCSVDGLRPFIVFIDDILLCNLLIWMSHKYMDRCLIPSTLEDQEQPVPQDVSVCWGSPLIVKFDSNYQLKFTIVYSFVLRMGAFKSLEFKFTYSSPFFLIV